MGIRAQVKQWLRTAGWSVGRYDPRADPVAVRRWLLESQAVDTVLDVGANSGQFARQLRAEGYAGRILSFEPLSSAYQALAASAAGDPLWDTWQCALGAAPGSAEINVAGNSWSSSLLPMLDRHSDAAPESAYVGKQSVTVATLDQLYRELCPPTARSFMKVDTQGFTMQVFAGGSAVLPHIRALQVELSLVPLYAGEPLIGEVLHYLYGQGFQLTFVEPEFGDQEGRQLQVNGLLVREGAER